MTGYTSYANQAVQTQKTKQLNKSSTVEDYVFLYFEQFSYSAQKDYLHYARQALYYTEAIVLGKDILEETVFLAQFQFKIYKKLISYQIINFHIIITSEIKLFTKQEAVYKMVANDNSSITTIFTLLNSMIGGAMLTFPVLFQKAGIITGIIVLVVSCMISYKTCRIYVMHLAPNDRDVEDTIRRIMGVKWQKFFRLITGFYLILLNIIYLILIIDQIYNIVFFIMSKAGAQESIANKQVDHLVFDKFSKQYLAIIMFFPLLALTFMKNLSFVIKLASYGVGSVFIYFAFLIYQFFRSLIEGVDFTQITWVSSNVGELAGTSAVAFTIHTVVATIIKSNKKQENNMRDLKISYLLGLLLYCAIGSMGYIAIWNLKCSETIVNCYLTDISSVFVEVSYLYGLSTVYPCFIEVGRSRLLLYFYPEVTKTHLRNFNLAFMSAAMLFCFLGPYINLNTVLNLVGSLVCFFFVYYIPTMLHLKCFYKKANDDKSSLLGSETTDDLQKDKECSHAKNEKDKYSYEFRRGGYFLVNLIGVGIGMYGIYLVFA